MTDLRYPLGKFSFRDAYDAQQVAQAMAEIEALPAQLKSAVEDLNHDQLATPYRPEGWTVAQVVHHLPDSHLNGYIRMKWALTEDGPTLRTYFEERWAELPDGASLELEMSLGLLAALHQRWVWMLRRLGPSQLERPVVHPEWGAVSLAGLVAQYAWHGRHHLAHITSLRQRSG
ncbi:MAG: putative metal-dependent hydrolase [Deltaproteobacteria bacterium]|nr:putative metal-dependent hydrolase [Deltaproteobacteria bacterium]